jgi:Carboxypeptidase regulatory-like domain
VKTWGKAGLIFAALLLAACVLCAQSAPQVSLEQVFSVHGTIVDEDGSPVGAVQVSLESAEPFGVSSKLPPTTHVDIVEAPLKATTNEAGSFFYSGLPAGRYSLRAEKPGYFVLKQQVTIGPGATDFTFTLNHSQEVREKVDVVASENRIEPAQTAQSDALTTADILNIPVPGSHDLQQSLIALPEIVRDNQDLLHIAGARNTQSQYLLDGFEIGDPISGELDARLSVDAVRTAKVQTSRFGAEYYHPGAAVLSFDTPEGDDQWRFGATDFIPGINVQQGVQFGNYYPRFSASGPIEKGKLWFSESATVQHTLSVVKDAPPGGNEVMQWSGDSLTRVLWHIAPNDSLHLSLLYNQVGDSNLSLDALHPQSVTYDIASHRVFGSAKDQLYWEKTLFEVGISGDSGRARTEPQGTAPYILLVNGAAGNYFQRFTQDGSRYQIFADANRAGLQWYGLHTISLGGNASHVEFSQDAQRGEIQALRADGTLDRLTTFTGPAAFELANTMAGGFVQDLWTPNRFFVVQAGARFDWDRYVHAVLAQPRVAANFLPFADGRAKFSAGWGIYNIPLNLSVIGQTYDQEQVDTLYDATGKIPVAGPATSRFVVGPGGLQQPYFLIESVGWQERFAGNTIVSVDLLARDENHGPVFATATPGQIGSDFDLTFSRRDKYRGATAAVRKQFANGTTLFGSYTRSRASTDQVLDPVLGQLYFGPQVSGPLSWDTPNRFLGWGSVPTPLWGILFAFLADYHTGYPFSVVNQQQFLVGMPNSLRFPAYCNLTLSGEKKFRLRGYIFAGRLAVVNVLNKGNFDTVVNNIDAPNFLGFYGGQGRAVTGRIRFVGKK